MIRRVSLLIALPLLLVVGACGEADDRSRVVPATDGPPRAERPSTSKLPNDLTTPKNIPMH